MLICFCNFLRLAEGEIEVDQRQRGEGQCREVDVGVGLGVVTVIVGEEVGMEEIVGGGTEPRGVFGSGLRRGGAGVGVR